MKVRVEFQDNEYFFFIWIVSLLAFSFVALIVSWAVIKYEDYKQGNADFCSGFVEKMEVSENE